MLLLTPLYAVAAAKHFSTYVRLINIENLYENTTDNDAAAPHHHSQKMALKQSSRCFKCDSVCVSVCVRV